MDDKRFQNYEAYFTVLETVTPISRKWLDALIYHHDESLQYAPDVWKRFIAQGRNRIVPLIAKKYLKSLRNMNNCRVIMREVFAWIKLENTIKKIHMALKIVQRIS